MRLRPGQSATITVKLAKQPGVLTIPYSALLTQSGYPYDYHGDCYRVVNGSAIRTAVKLGSLGDEGRRIQVLSGLNDGDQVITRPTPDIKDGQPIAPAKE